MHCLTLLLALATTSLAPPVDHSVEFLGFSRGDALAAWRTQVTHAQPNGSVDHFALVKLIEVNSTRLVATFRDGAIYRVDPQGHRHPASKSLAAVNPEWRDAGPHAAWLRLQRKGRFNKRILEFKDSLVRIMLDQDSTQAAVHADEKKHLWVDGQPGRPLGYVPIARLFEGEMMPLGHYRLDTPAQEPVRAELQVFHSVDGRCIAVINHFFVANGAPPVDRAVILRTDPKDPIGNTGMGTLEMVEAQARSTERAFREVHPKEIKDYDKYIGTFF